jgi:hypothetical protein
MKLSDCSGYSVEGKCESEENGVNAGVLKMTCVCVCICRRERKREEEEEGKRREEGFLLCAVADGEA